MKKRLIPAANLLVLSIILCSTIALFLAVKDDKLLQVLIGILMSVLYVAWGIIHHSVKGDMHPKVVVEYLLVGAIAIILIMTVVWM